MGECDVFRDKMQDGEDGDGNRHFFRLRRACLEPIGDRPERQGGGPPSARPLSPPAASSETGPARVYLCAAG